MRDAAFEMSRQYDDGSSTLLGRFVTFVFFRPIRAAQRRATLRHLMRMDDAMLLDIGLTRHDLEQISQGRATDLDMAKARAGRWNA
jgi:uncharacterized protein YjiS (DUF1127 family)